MGEISQSPGGSKYRIVHKGGHEKKQVLTVTPGGKNPVFHYTAPEGESRQDAKERNRDNKTLNQCARRIVARAEMGPEEKSHHLEARHKSDSVKAHCSLGDDLYDSKDFPGAEAEFRTALAIDPQCFDAHQSLGIILMDRRDSHGAEAEFLAATAICPQDFLSHYNLGVALALNGDEPGAETQYRKALKLNPAHACSRLNLGVILYKKEDLAGAEGEYWAAIGIDSKYSDAHFNLGIVLQARGELAEAEAQYRAVLEINPGNGKASAALAGLQ